MKAVYKGGKKELKRNHKEGVLMDRLKLSRNGLRGEAEVAEEKREDEVVEEARRDTRLQLRVVDLGMKAVYKGGKKELKRNHKEGVLMDRLKLSRNGLRGEAEVAEEKREDEVVEEARRDTRLQLRVVDLGLIIR
ncbi:hypothetical protein F2Q70_00012683 [Brassica cretica]|uniref:Uncharacterized protein n=1 Tax=Brassica cretica TaxID=69181 RepID=A0A8S9LU85_BRACR|nr:hypothetical protein F2Q70_00012683 [Brassica cretica]